MTVNTQGVFPVGHIQGFVQVLTENHGYKRRFAVRNGSSIWHVPNDLAEAFVEIAHSSHTVESYDLWARHSGVNLQCDLHDLIKSKIALIGLGEVDRNPFMFKFRPTCEEVETTSGAGDLFIPSRKLGGIKVSEPTFHFWLASFEASSVHDAIAMSAAESTLIYEDAKTAILKDLDQLLHMGSGRLEYLNLASPKGNWYFA